jgi:hypothetical protein
MDWRRRHLRGLAELKTRSGLGARRIAPHAAYMKITALELEKLRLSRVRDNALKRIADIEARCVEIQGEKAALLAALGAEAPIPASPVAGARNRGVSLRRGGALSLRY